MLQSEVRTASRAAHLDNANQAVLQALAAEIPASEIMTSITTTIDRFHAEQCELPGISARNGSVIYDELPDGLIDLPSAARELGLSLTVLNTWIGKGHIQSYGRLKAPARGGGFHLLKMSEILAYRDSRPIRGGRPRKPR